MDKELLRLVIIAVGVIAVVSMVLWSFFKNKNPRRTIDFYDKGNPLDKIDESLIVNTDNDDFDIVPLGTALNQELAPDPITVASEKRQLDEPMIRAEMPKLIQFSLVAVADEGFNGNELVAAFQHVGLEYGSMHVFERLDKKRRVDFAVASMVEPGTFPEKGLETFSSPGIVFFTQPSELQNPLAVFDEFIQTIKLLAIELDGIEWDHNRQPLTEDTIQQFRLQLGA